MSKKDKPPEFAFKILLLGDPFVGKTALVNRYVKNSFTKSYLHTIGMETSTRIEKIAKRTVALQLYDIAGDHNFARMRTMFYKGSRGGLIVFDLTRKETFISVETWLKEAVETSGGGHYILVGNKSDLDDQRQVKKADVDKLIKKLKFTDYIETSALTGDFVKESFLSLANIIFNETHKK